MAKLVIKKVQAPNGDIIPVQVPEGTPIEQIIAKAQKMRFVPQEPEQYNPTAGMTGTEKFLAGAGKGMTDVARGAGQLLGVNSQQEIDEAAQLDRPLMNTGAGKGGFITGGMASFLPTAAIPGANTVAGSALIGAGTGLLQPVETGESRLEHGASGAMWGAGTAAALRVLPQLVKAVVDPFRKSGVDDIVGRTLDRFATGSGAPASAKTPGWEPTLSQATRDPGLAVLERGAGSASPDIAAALARRALEQNAAAANAVRGIAGTPQTRAMAEGLRSYMTEGLYKDAAEGGVNQSMSKALKPQIENLMARPSVQAAIRRAEGLMDELSIAKAKSGSVEGLQLVKQALDDSIEKAGSATSSIGKNQLRALEQTRGDLISIMEQIAPKLREADRNYAIFSRPINESKVGQALEEKLVPALMSGEGMPSRVRAQEFAAALQSLDDKIPRITGYAGSTVDNTLSPGNVNLLEGIKADLATRAAAQESARGVGSNTAQNLASQDIMAQIFGPLGMPRSWADALAQSTLGRTAASIPGLIYKRAAEPNVQEQLARALLDPRLAQQLRMQAGQSALPQMLQRPAAYLPSALVPGVVGATNAEK